MICQKIDFDSPLIVHIYALRQKELRTPLGLNLFDEDLLSEQTQVFFVGLENEKVVTCLQFQIKNNTTLKLRQMATDNQSQGKGCGKQLVQFAEAWAGKNRYKSIELNARKIAQGFYEKLGYEKVGAEFLEVDMPHYKMVKGL